jgi:hypothetical protein
MGAHAEERPPPRNLRFWVLFELRRNHMPRQIITTPNAPSSPLYSQGAKAGSLVFVSGTTGIDPSTSDSWQEHPSLNPSGGHQLRGHFESGWRESR